MKWKFSIQLLRYDVENDALEENNDICGVSDASGVGNDGNEKANGFLAFSTV